MWPSCGAKASIPVQTRATLRRSSRSPTRLGDLELDHGHVFTERDTIDILGIAVPVAALLLEKRET